MITNKDARKEALERNLFYKALEENSKVEDEKDNYSNYLENQNRINARNNIQHEYSKFVDSIDKVLLSEAFSKIFDKSRALIYTIRKNNTGKDIIKKYFNESDIIDLERNMKNQNTLFLSDLLKVVEGCHKDIMSHVDKNNEETFKITPEDMESFYDKLDSESFDDASEMIKARVSAAVQDFVMNNKEDKAKMEELLNSTKNSIDSLSVDSQEEATKITEAINAQYKQNINKIHNRDKSLLEEMVYSNYEEIIKDPEMIKEFTNEDGKIDIDTIIEYAEIQYTVLEMFNTLKVETLDKDKIIGLLS